MGVEFRLGRNDHKKVEDFLARKPGGVSGVILDTRHARYQTDASAAARALGATVAFDPATERLADPGFELQELPYGQRAPYDLDHLASNTAARLTLVREVLTSHPDGVTVATPPHFFVSDGRSAALNVALAEATIIEADQPVRPVLLLSTRYGGVNAERLAREYASVGAKSIDLRLSPVGGEDEGVRKVRSIFEVADKFRDVGISVMLGHSGNIGRAALALAHVDSYSVGIGLGEKVDHAERIGRQKKPRVPEDEEKGGPFGAISGVYLPGLSVTVSRQMAAHLLGQTDIRTRIGCRVGSCGTSVHGPELDPREHYLHSRAKETAEMLGRPAPWRSTLEADRLQKALELRTLVNEKYIGDGPKMKTRTLRSLLEDIQGEQAARGTA